MILNKYIIIELDLGTDSVRPVIVEVKDRKELLTFTSHCWRFIEDRVNLESMGKMPITGRIDNKNNNIVDLQYGFRQIM